MSDPTPTSNYKKTRRRQPRRTITDEEIGELLARREQPPAPPPPTEDREPGLPRLPTATRDGLGLTGQDWRKLEELNARNKPVSFGGDLDAFWETYKAQTDEANAHLEAVSLFRGITELQSILADMDVKGPKLRAAQYYARGSRFKTGAALLTFIWRTLNPPR